MHKIKFNFNTLPIIILSALILCAFCLSIHYVYASSSSFAQCDKSWEGYSNKINANIDDTYPYNSSTAKINAVSLDILYGTTRNLAVYHGELPYSQIYTEDGEILEGWEGYYANDGTTVIEDTNPTYGAISGESISDYWGNNVTEDNFKNLPTAEQINSSDSGIVSLRLLALANTKSGIIYWLGVALYTIVKVFAWIAVFLIELIVTAKNLDMDLIMNFLHLDDLNDMLTKNFIWDGDHLKLSAFTAFCIIALILSITAFVIRWVKGADKTKGIWEIIGTAVLGLLIIGMCLTGRISSLGSSVAALANNAMYSAAQSLSSTGNGNAFLIEIKDPGNETKITQLCEMSLVNKAFIDLQLCCQFNVNSVDQLKFDNLGDPDGVNAQMYLSGLDEADIQDDFNNNLGYYFWFANSSAKYKTSKNAAFPETDTQSAENKLNSIITYLQHQYNTCNDAETKDRIITIMMSLSNPAGNARFLCLLLFAIALILMAIVLLKYTLNVIIAKIELFIALLGMVLAGPLIITTNKKLVETGKAILGMLVVSFLEVTIYSIIFDIIIYVVSSMFAPAIPNLLAVIGLLALLLKFNPIISQKIKQIMEKTTRNISPALVDGRRAVKQWAKTKVNDRINNYDNKERVVGYDAEGNAIKESRKGDALSKLMHHSANAMFTEGNETKSMRKINKELSDVHNKNKNMSAKQRRVAAQTQVNKCLSTIDNEAKRNADEINAEISKKRNSAYDRVYDDNGNIISESFNMDNLSDSEKEMVSSYNNHKNELDELISSKNYQDLLMKRHSLETDELMDETELKQLQSYQAKIGAKRQQIKNEQSKIHNSITERAAIDVMQSRGLEFNTAEGESIDEKVNNATKLNALNNHRDELETTLNTAINTMTAEVNDTSKKGKIGSDSTSSVNKNAATDQAAAMLQLNQLKNGEIVSNTMDAKQQVEDIVEKVAIAEEYTNPKNAVNMVTNDVKSKMHIGDNSKKGQELNAAKDAYHNSRPGSKQHAELKNKYDNTLKTYQNTRKDDINSAISAYSDARKSVNGGVIIDRASISEQLQHEIDKRNKHTSNMSAIINQRENSQDSNKSLDEYSKDESKLLQHQAEVEFWSQDRKNEVGDRF